MGRRREARELHWRNILQQQAESGLSIAKFCRQESISAPSFYLWRRKLKERETEGCSKKHPVSAKTISGTHLLPVRIESSGPPESVRVLLPQGMAIDAPSRIDPNALADLIRVLREAF